jgi:hypothetical protein
LADPGNLVSTDRSMSDNPDRPMFGHLSILVRPLGVDP